MSSAGDGKDNYHTSSFFPFSNDVVKDDRLIKDFAIPSAIVSSLVLLPFDNEAFAAASDYGILTGRTASMAHPVTMLLLLATSLYSGYLGLQWRRLRGLSDEIKDLQMQMPSLSSGKKAVYPVQSLIDELNNEWVSITDEAKKEIIRKDLNILKDSVIIDSKIGELQSTRKQLQGENLKDKHFTSGSWLLGVGVTVSLLGAFNTFMRAGKLFPGPHLYAGMAITMMWALAAALVPAMQKGSESARIAHIGMTYITPYHFFIIITITNI